MAKVPGKNVRVRWYGDRYRRKVEKHMENNLEAAAITLANVVIDSFGSGGVSLAGKPPNVQTGHLMRNTTNYRAGRMKQWVGTGIGNAENVGYAMWLEFGSRRMKARPFLRTALRGFKKRFKKFMGIKMR